jgi:hypothetical protein
MPAPLASLVSGPAAALSETRELRRVTSPQLSRPPPPACASWQSLAPQENPASTAEAGATALPEMTDRSMVSVAPGACSPPGPTTAPGGTSTPPPNAWKLPWNAVSAYVAGVLRELGYRVHLHVVTFESISEARRRHFQLSVDGDWVADYPEPSAYLPQFFGCAGGDSNGYYCNPRLDNRMQSATSDNLKDPERAARRGCAFRGGDRRRRRELRTPSTSSSLR